MIAVTLYCCTLPRPVFSPYAGRVKNTEGNSMAKKKPKQEPVEIPPDESDDAKILSPLDDQMLSEEEEAYWKAAAGEDEEYRQKQEKDEDIKGSGSAD